MNKLFECSLSRKTKSTSLVNIKKTPEATLEECLNQLVRMRISTSTYNHQNNPFELEGNSTLLEKRIDTYSNCISKTNCYKSEGLITQITESFAQIDGKLNVMLKLVDPQLLDNLEQGSSVEYLFFQSPNSKKCKVHLLRILLDDWIDQNNIRYPIETKDKILNSDILPHVEARTYYETESRTIQGKVIDYAAKANTITFLAEGTLAHTRIDLSDVAMSFRPRIGDKLSLLCNVQIELDTSKNCIERILDVVTLSPFRMKHSEICRVTSVHTDYFVLSEKYICLIEDIGDNIEELDVLLADIIETNMFGYSWRAINLRKSVPVSVRKQPTLRNNKDTSAEFSVNVTDNMVCNLDNVNTGSLFNMEMWNNKNEPIRMIGVSHKVKNPIVIFKIVVKMPSESNIILRPNEIRKLFFQIKPIKCGNTMVYLTIKFDTMEIKRSILIIVGDTRPIDPNMAKTMENEQFILSSMNGMNIADNRDVVPRPSDISRKRFVKFRIPNYEPNENMRKLYFLNRTDHNAITHAYPYIVDELDESNYLEKFETLLTFEELEHGLQFVNFNMSKVHFERDGEFLSLTIPDLMDRRPSLAIGDVARIHSSWIGSMESDLSYDGVINKVINNRILIKFCTQFHLSYHGEEYNIQFQFSRFQYRKLHHAIIKAISELEDSLLFPKELVARRQPEIDACLSSDDELIIAGNKSNWFNSNLNPIQKMAIVNIMRNEALNVPYIIFGPPGTGKTMTVIETILQIFTHHPGARILVAAPSNSAVDLIASRLIDSGVLLLNDLLRIVSHTALDKDSINAKIAPYCATIDIGIDGTSACEMQTNELGIKMRCKSNYISQFRVVIGTCSVIGTFHTMPLSVNHFTHVIVDESGQCSEPEVMLVITQISKMKKSRVILAGDPLQMQSICISSIGKKYGLTYSYLERIMNTKLFAIDNDLYKKSCGYNPKCIMKLLYNYRSLPSILKIYSDLFYLSELIPTLSENCSNEAKKLFKIRKILLPKLENCPSSHGLFMFTLFGNSLRELNSPSWCNPLEAKYIFSFVMKLIKNGISSEQIGIIAPYVKQIKFMRYLFTDVSEDNIPKIGTVEEFQGQERDIIFISTVRSCIQKNMHSPIGFLSCPKRINVAISRGRCFVCIVGDANALRTNEYWNSIINYCADNNALVNPTFPDGLTTEVIDQLSDKVAHALDESVYSSSNLLHLNN